ncbi:MAG: TonB-dependent receptor [Bacteroidota bacterium]
MNVKITAIVVVLTFASTFCLAADISGTVYNSATKEPLPGATVVIQGTTIGSVTDEDGRYIIKNIAIGTYILEASSLGFEKLSKEVELAMTGNVVANFTLTERAEQLGEIVVRGKTEAQLLSQQPIAAAMVDVQAIQSRPVEIARVLDDLPGVRVRQSGGFGSTTQIQLNGATGEAVRVYFDGVPLEYLSSGTSINTLPVNLIKRLEVYKGVMPIHLGTDALAGGINIVTREPYKDFLDVSYEVGSFNTHRATLNTYKVTSNNFFTGINAFYNYSDNNFWMNVENRTYTTDDNGVLVPGPSESIRIRRFHNVHKSYFAEAHLGVRDKSWTDELSYRVAYVNRYDENQHGSRVTSVPAGAAFQEEEGIVQRIKFKKDGIFNGKLDIRYDGSLNIVNQFTSDSTTSLYDWRGIEYTQVRTSGLGFGEIGAATLRDIDQISTSHRLSLAYKIHDSHSFNVSNFFGSQQFEGNDPVRTNSDRFDPNTVPAIIEKNILGVSYVSHWFNDRLELNLFGKNYFYKSESADIFSIRTNSDPISVNDSENGFGLGSKWTFDSDLFVRFSYERAVRLPNEVEVFGNFVTSRPNYNISPEKSNNFNLGAYWSRLFKKNRYTIDLSTFYREQEDLIFFVPIETGLGQFRNLSSAQAQGVEATVKASFAEFIDIGINVTKQRIISTSTAFGDEPFFEQPIPSRPDFFASSSVTYFPKFSSNEERKFSISLFTTFVEEFNFILEGGRRNDDNYVPRQFVNDLGISYQMDDKNLTFSFQLNNITDEEVFDLVSIPRPGRNFRFKMRYALN